MKTLKVTRLAQELRGKQEKLEEMKKTLCAPLEATIEELREELLEEMKLTAMRDLKLETGEMFVRSERVSFKVLNEQRALDWAKEHNALKLDTTKANKLLKREFNLPAGFEEQRTEYLSVRKANGNGEDED
jgi:hypothetical protein